MIARLEDHSPQVTYYTCSLFKELIFFKQRRLAIRTFALITPEWHTCQGDLSLAVSYELKLTAVLRRPSYQLRS